MGVVRFKEIERRRLALNLTMAAAAKLAGWKTAQAWSHVEKGHADNPSIETMRTVARVLGCKVDDLLKR